MALPWLVYFSVGPTPVILQALVSAAVLGTLWRRRYHPKIYTLILTTWDRCLRKAGCSASGLSAIAGLIQYFDLASGMQPWISESSGVAFAESAPTQPVCVFVPHRALCRHWHELHEGKNGGRCTDAARVVSERDGIAYRRGCGISFTHWRDWLAGNCCDDPAMA